MPLYIKIEEIYPALRVLRYTYRHFLYHNNCIENFFTSMQELTLLLLLSSVFHSYRTQISPTGREKIIYNHG